MSEAVMKGTRKVVLIKESDSAGCQFDGEDGETYLLSTRYKEAKFSRTFPVGALVILECTGRYDRAVFDFSGHNNYKALLWKLTKD